MNQQHHYESESIYQTGTVTPYPSDRYVDNTADRYTYAPFDQSTVTRYTYTNLRLNTKMYDFHSNSKNICF